MARAVSPRSDHVSQNIRSPPASISQKFACQPKAWSSTPPIAGAIIGTSAMPIVT